MSDWHTKRSNNANEIWNTSRQCKGLRVPNIPDYIKHAAYKCYVFVELKKLKKSGVVTKLLKR